jgi:hypothetical protein
MDSVTAFINLTDESFSKIKGVEKFITVISNDESISLDQLEVSSDY